MRDKPTSKARFVEAQRLPPGQYETKQWPVLHHGAVPKVTIERWDFRIFGSVEELVVLSYDEFMALPRTTVRSDIHCVTRWSRFDNLWEGVAFQEVMKLVGVKPEARFVLVHAENNYATNMPLEELLKENVLFAFRNNGQDISPEHGWPLRLVVPHLYFWKSAKWVRGLEFMDNDRAGFWESYGYHMRGDPWAEERYWSD